MLRTLTEIIQSNTQSIPTSIMMLGLLITTMCAIPIILLINKYAYDEKGNLVCDDYVLNSYLYTALGFCYIAIGVILEQKIQIIPRVAMYGFISLLFFSIIYLVIMYILFNKIRTTNPKNTIEINSYYALASILFGIVLAITIMMGISVNVIYPAIAITIGLTFIMGYIGYKYGHKFINVEFDKYLTYSLIALIIWIFIAPFIFRDIKTLLLVISIPCAIIFCLLLMSYNKKLRENSKTCKVPNYPDEAIGLVTKIGNLLSNIIRILTALRGKRRGRNIKF